MSFQALGVGLPSPESFVKGINVAQTQVSACRGTRNLGKDNKSVLSVQIVFPKNVINSSVC